MGKGKPAVIATVHERVPGGGKGGNKNPGGTHGYIFVAPVHR